jgi:DNA-binding NtrC family response regulator
VVEHCPDGASAQSALRRGRFDLVLLDLGLPDLPGEELLAKLRASKPWVPVIMTTGKLDAEAALECLRLGARDYLTKPFSLPQLSGAVQRELRQSALSRRLRSLQEREPLRGLERLVGKSEGLQQARALLQKAAPLDIGVLLGGETGTGKDLAAQALHEAGPRAKGPFLALDCGALPAQLLESELFGHERGAFTGAETAKKGRMELAAGGTLFLDEVGELSPASQAKLLRVLQERKLRRLGGSVDISVDVRVIAATHVDLADARREARFREDLYHRLAEFSVRLPPLRERGDDIILLAERLLQDAALAFEKPVQGLDEGAQRALKAYPWPGNVRELLHALRRGLIRCGDWLTAEDLPDRVTGRGGNSAAPAPVGPLAAQVQAAMDIAEKAMLTRALEASRWQRGETARRLGVDAKTLGTRMKRHGLEG